MATQGLGALQEAEAGRDREAEAGASDWLTIEQLAAATGMTVRNIRSHRARGLLPPPEVRDRVGYYGPEHLARLRVIRELQAEGFNLRGIKRLLEATHGTAEHLLGLKAAVTAPFQTEEPQVFTLEELAERFGLEVGPEELAKAQRIGVLVPLGADRFEAPVPSLLDVAEEVMRRGVPLGHALAVVEKLAKSCRSVSGEFVRLFLDDLWKPFVAAGYPESRWTEVLESIERLRPLASQAMLAMFQLTMSAEVEAAFGKEIERLSKGKRR
jgi:DNA-binding transcriptional MerR regulator